MLTIGIGTILGKIFQVYIAARMGINTYKTVKMIIIKVKKPQDDKKEVLQ